MHGMKDSVQIIPADHYKNKGKEKSDKYRYLNVSEFFTNTIQGEGVHIGRSATFLRLSGCSLSCKYCDTANVWSQGTPFSFIELFDLMSQFGVIKKLAKVDHFVITGGSPLLQQYRLTMFLMAFEDTFRFLPIIEIENECVIQPTDSLCKYIDTWNNSPKLTDSEIPAKKRYKKDVIQYMSKLPNSWFKFVISNEDQWKEIDEFFLKPRLIHRSQVILMPEGATRVRLEQNRDMVVEMCIQNNVRFSTREHIILWDDKKGV